MSDLIERQAAIEKAYKIAGYDRNAYVVDVADIEALPSVSTETDSCNDEELDFVQPHKKIKVNLVPCGDAISRQAVEEIINDIRDCISVEGYCAILERLKKLPPVSTEKTGRWIESNGVGMFVCSVCNESFYPMPTCLGKPLRKDCPNCGARMEVEE